MYKQLFIFLLIAVIGLTNLTAQDLRIFYLRFEKNESVGFVSLSDVYPLSEHPDSLAIPDLKDINSEEAKNFEYLKLDAKQRKRFLSKTKILETDQVFIYDYSADVLICFTVKNLNVVACLNIYGADWPYSQNDYMIGFELNKKFLTSFGRFPSNTLVCVGKENPFVQGQMKHIVWKKIDNKDFPSREINPKDTARFKHVYNDTKVEYVSGNTFKYLTEGLEYFIQDTGKYNDNQIWAKRLLVIDRKTKEIVYEKMYYESESGSFAPINNQWTGKLFKNKPPVIFGFKWVSFGCPRINFLNSTEKDIDTNCDNRH